METRRLEYFVQIADAGSINRAAAALGVAQPALSQQLAVLEAELKTRLLDRSSSGITLTDAGRALYTRARIILRQVGGLRSELVDAAQGVSGQVSIGIPPSHGLSIGGPLLERVLRDYPNVRLQIVEDGAAGLALQLRRGALDLTLSPVRISDPDLLSEQLLQEELVLVHAQASPPVPADLAGLAALPWIVTSSPNAIRGHLNALFAQAELEPNIVAEVNSLPLVIAAVGRGLGVTLLPRAAAAEALASGRIKASPFGEKPLLRTLHLYTSRHDVPTNAVRVVADLVRSIAASVAAGQPAI